MRYKEQVIINLEQLHNGFSHLEYMLRQGATREQVADWIEKAKEKIEHIQTLVNREPS